MSDPIAPRAVSAVNPLPTSSGPVPLPAPPTEAGPLRFGRIAGGFCLRVEGRGTMRESPAAQDFALRALADEGATLVLDLSGCDYLDSTFLGCVVGLHRRYGVGGAGRFRVAAPPEKRVRLFGPLNLHLVLRFIDAAPAAEGEWVALSAQQIGSAEHTRHVMECHRRLAEADGPPGRVFAAIADRLGRELGESGRG